MAIVAAYRQSLERLYTLIGKEFALLVIAVNPDTTGSNVAARELVLVGRSVSTECKQGEGIRQVIQGPVIRYDLIADVSKSVTLKAQDVHTALDGRSIASGVPLILALVGVEEAVVNRLRDSACQEKKEMEELVSGGYLVLSYSSRDKMANLDLCEKPTTISQRGSKLLASSKPVSHARFLIGEERIDPTRNMVYAIRVQEKKQVFLRPKDKIPVAVVEAPPDPMKAIRATRWQRVEASKDLVPVSGPAWEKLIQSVVEREVNKIITTAVGAEEVVTIQLGDGLTARVWPDLVHKISMAREWMSVFTHQSVDPTPRANYEAFETLGDKVLSLSLIHYLLSTNDPTRIIDSNGLTDSHKDILSNVRQPAMAAVMGLNQHGLIRSSVSIDDQMLEDVQEAFFGCLFTVANKLTEGSNQGLPICEALFRVILQETFPQLDPWSVPKDPQTTLDQVFIKMNWGHPIRIYDEETKVTTIRLTRDAHSFLESVGPKIKMDRPFIVGPKSADKTSSARAAAELALSSLKLGWGIDSRYASMTVRARLMRDERYAKVQREALKVAEKMGFTDIYVARRAKNHNQLYAVMGVRPDDSEAQLHIYKYQSPESRDTEEDTGLSTRVAAYITALRGFISSTSVRA